MESAWSDLDAAQAVQRWAGAPRCNDDVALRVYSSRLIGRAPGLVLHGGGNTSVKTRLPDESGAAVEVLCVKGSGWDLAQIEPEGFPAVRLESLNALRALGSLSDEDMVNAARVRLLDASAPNPSVEVLLHAFLPHKFIDHSHADAILALVDQPDAAGLVREIYGDRLAVVPYIMPGFALAKLAAEVYERQPDCEGLLLLQHGLFTFGATARESYERHVGAVSAAEHHIAAKRGSAPNESTAADRVDYAALAPVLRGRLGAQGARYVLALRRNDAVRRFVDSPALPRLSQRGPATPDHVIRTKQRPLCLDAVRLADDAVDHIDAALEDYRGRYRAYVDACRETRGRAVTPLDPDPRIILVPGLGLIGVGSSPRAAAVAADLYEHTIGIICAAEAVGSYQALPDVDIFDMEYWSLEQAKLGRRPARPLDGHVVYITGAAAGIGAATARRFAQAGASLFLVDRDGPTLQRLAAELGARCQVVDVCDRDAVERSFDAVVLHYGGVDGVVSNAGTAPQAAIDTCPPEVLADSFAVNLFAHQWVAAAATRVLRAQGTGGFLLFNASKAAFNPGKGFGPYAVAKAALVALMKQYALEGGDAGIRAGAVNADRIRTGLLSPDHVEARARARGLEVGDYFRANLLHREVSAQDVAEAFVTLALAKSTTGAVLPVDGGNLAAAPR